MANQTTEPLTLEPIGIIHTPFKEPSETPIQTVFGKEYKGTVEVFPAFVDGLNDVSGFSHIYLLFYFHTSTCKQLLSQPYLDSKERGIFAIRGPKRPNPIGLSIVEILSIEDGTIHIKGIDMLDGSPLLDIKPYIERFDSRTNTRSGWIQEKLS